TPADLASVPVVEKGADAEVLFWDVDVDQAQSKTVLSHYIRIKVFTQRGAENQSRVDLTYAGKDSIKDIAGRTVQPDGTITELKADGVFERTLATAKKLRLRSKSFALPNVRPGAVIEYRWTEVISDTNPYSLPLAVQRDVPIQVVRYSINNRAFKDS